MNVENIFDVEVEVRNNEVNEISFQDEQLSNHSLKTMYDFMKDNKLTDIVLISDNDKQRFPIHKVVLSAVSTYFTAMFTSNLKESIGKEIVFKDIDGAILKQIIEFCYTGHIDVNVENVEALFIASNMFQFNFIINSCMSFLVMKLDTRNCFEILHLGIRYSSKDLVRKTQRFINEHFMEIIEYSDFLNLEVDYIVQLLKNEYLNITSENVAFEAVRKWISVDHNRQKYIPILMSYIELKLVPIDFLFDTILPFCGSYTECLNLIIEASRWHLQPHQRLSLTSKIPRSYEPTINHLLAVGGIQDTEDDIMGSEIYCPKSGKWYCLSNIFPRKMNYSAIAIDQKLYILGGRQLDKGDNAFECVYSENKNSKENLPSMLEKRFCFGVASIDDNLYVVGGSNGTEYLNTVEKFNLRTKKWIYSATMVNYRSNLGVTVLDGNIYALGGRNRSGVLKCFEVYNSYVNKWTVLDPMITARYDFDAVAFNGCIYVYGGGNFKCDRTYIFDRYDLKAKIWIPLLNIKRFLNGVSLILIDESLICVGGHSGNKALKMVVKYDIKKDKEISIADLNFPRSSPALFNVEKQIPSVLNHCLFCKKMKY